MLLTLINKYLLPLSRSSDSAVFQCLWEMCREQVGFHCLGWLQQLDMEGCHYEVSLLVGESGEVLSHGYNVLSLPRSEQLVSFPTPLSKAHTGIHFWLTCLENKSLFENIPAHMAKALALGVAVEGRLQHWLLIYLPSSQRVTSDQLGELSLLANLFFAYQKQSWDKAQFDEANHWIGHELSSMAHIQQSLHPDESVSIQGIQVAVDYQAFKYVGGDYYDLMDLSSYLADSYPGFDKELSAWGVIIGDVSGHGPGAAVEAAMLDAILRTFRGDFETAASEVINYLNQHFFTRKSRGNIVTLFTANYEPVFQTLRYACAGHPPPLIRRANGVIEVLDQSQDIPLGVVKDYRWNILQTQFLPGDLLLLYTDGVTEAANSEKQEFGLKRLITSVEEGYQGCVNELIEHINRSLEQYCGGNKVSDDRTIVAIANLGE